LASQGKQIPITLLKQIEHDKMMEIKSDIFNSNLSNKNNNNNNEEVEEENIIIGQQPLQQKPLNKQQMIQQHLQQQHLQQQYLQQKYLQQQQQQHIRSRQQPKAQASARIGLGGVF
jgi:hypothetical protein